MQKDYIPLTELNAWKQLKKHYLKIKELHLRQLFSEDPERGKRFTLETSGIHLDYSKHLIIDETLHLLLQLAEESGLREHIEAMFRGEKINITEERSVLHVALRTPRDKSIFVNKQDVIPVVYDIFQKMEVFSEKVRSGLWKGYTGKSIRNIVNVGIGGSDLGPVMVYEALKYYNQSDMTFRFISNIDGTDFTESTMDLNPEETLFIISSKTFKTLETMTNANTARKWILQALKYPSSVSRHFVAVSTNRAEVEKFGIDPENIFEFWDWVGGRYSIESAIGLSTMIAIGPEHFREMLYGFHEMDEHFYNAPFENNLPVLMGLLGVWYNNFFNTQTMAILPYAHYLKRFPAYLQQLTMESNGKQTTIEGERINYQTGTIYWGEPGTNSQHSFYQLIHQGTKLIPCDFIAFIKPLNDLQHHHNLLTANVFAQSEALAFGKTLEEALNEGISEKLAQHRTFPGNRPSSMLLMEKLTPEALGKLIALYEHIVFTQGVIWQINSFDQWGVELGKKLAEKIIPELSDKSESQLNHDSSTNSLIQFYRQFN